MESDPRKVKHCQGEAWVGPLGEGWGGAGLEVLPCWWSGSRSRWTLGSSQRPLLQTDASWAPSRAQLLWATSA
jgi:hypothetical protein